MGEYAQKLQQTALTYKDNSNKKYISTNIAGRCGGHGYINNCLVCGALISQHKFC